MILLHRINPERNERRFYLVATGPTLLDEYAVQRTWGRIGGAQRCMITPCASAEELQSLAERLVWQKLKRGYVAAQIGAIRMDARDLSLTKDLLSAHLEVAVFLYIAELKERGGPDDEDYRRLAQISWSIAAKGDQLLFRSNRAGELVDQLAYGLAVMSFCPGGVKAFGHRWETTLPDKEAAEDGPIAGPETEAVPGPPGQSQLL